MEFIELVFVGAVIGLIPAFIARSKGHPFGLWWLYGGGLFIFAFPHALMLKPAEGHGARKCPFCAELIKEEARVCRYCGRDLPEVLQSKSEAVFEPQSEFECPKCRAEVAAGDDRCRKCGARFEPLAPKDTQPSPAEQP